MKKVKKPVYKKWWICVIAALVVSMFCTGCIVISDKDDPDSSQQSISDDSSAPAEPSAEAEGESDDEDDDDGPVKSGRYTLPSGMNVNFSDSVRNDVTGNWRIATTSDSFVPADYALEYYETLFSSDDEIHAIWNATLGTMTSIKVGAGMGCLFVDTYEYVAGEEHDAKLLFSGMLLDSRIISIETGEPLDLEG